MKSKAVRQLYPLFFLCIVVSILLWVYSYKTRAVKTENVNQDVAAKVRLLNVSQFAKESDFKCMSVEPKLTNLTFPMCLYTEKEDVWVSKLFLKGGYFEEELVIKFVDLFKKYYDITFLDLGANLGTYSLPISHLGRHVIAVEPNPDTYRRLAKSIYLGGTANTVDAINCAVADDIYISTIDFDSTNRGDTFILQNSSNPCKSNCSTALTTTLDSLLPLIRNKKVIMKVDTQESEIRIFTEKGAAKFFEIISVPMIMMEWNIYTLRYRKAEAKRMLVDRFLEFFYRRGYEVYDPRTEAKLSKDWTRWGYDILLKKESLRSKKLFSIGE